MSEPAAPAPGRDGSGRVSGRRRRRRWPWVLVLLAGLLGVGAWLAFGVVGAARTIRSEAAVAQAQVRAVQDAIGAGDYEASARSARAARAAVDSARDAAGTPALRVVGALPVVGTAVDDVDALIGAAGDLSDVTDRLVAVYGSATGKAPGSTRLFRDGRVDLVQAAALREQVTAMQTSLADAVEKLESVKGTAPGTGILVEARDEALAEIEPVQEAVATVKPLVDQLPALLGADSPKRYLVAILNPAELRASGGAPLSVAVIAFAKGTLSVPVIGSTAGDIFPGNPLITWPYAGPPPFVPAKGQQGRFVNSTFNPDLRLTGPNITRAWVAGGRAPVDGVLMLDTTALEALLRATGPVTTAGYGEVTADNLRDKILVEAYRDYTSDDGSNTTRRGLNLALAQVLLARLTAGDQLIATVRALADVAPGRHVQAWFPDAALEQAVRKAGFAGEVRTPTGDQVAVFSQNGNMSKVDIFQQRSVTQTVALRADGGADVTQTVRVVNAVPKGAGNGSREGYLTAWSRSAWYLYLPKGAKVTAFQRPRQYTDATVTDGLGRTLKQTIGWISPGSFATITLRYSLPAGRFGGGDAIRYTLAADPQAVWPPVSLTVRVVPPAGWQAQAWDGATVKDGTVSWTTPLDRPIDVELTARPA